MISLDYHFNYLLMIFFFGIGLSSLVTFTSVTLKTRNKKLFAVFIFYLSFTLFMLADIVFNFFFIYSVKVKYYQLIMLGIIHTIFFNIMIFSIPLFINIFTDFKYTKIVTMIFSLLFLLNVINETFFIIFENTEQGIKEGAHLNIHLSTPIILLIAMIYSTILGFFQYKSMKDEIMRTLLKNMCIVAAIFTPLIVYEFYPQIFPFIQLNLLFHPFLYGAFSIIFFIFIIKVYLRDYYISQSDIQRISQKNNSKSHPQIFNKYQLSQRERDTLILLLKGYSNKKIADQLFISLSTVKTHIYNIFRKTKVSNRYELIYLIKN